MINSIKKFFLFFKIFVSVGFLRADVINDLHSKPPCKLSKFESWSRKKFDEYVGCQLGLMAPKKNMEEFIRLVQHEMDMDGYCIEVRCMSQDLIKQMGGHNAFAIGSMLGKKRHSYIYIDESWFESLTSKQVRVIIGHELMHIKASHTQKKILYTFIGSFFFCSGFISTLFLNPFNVGLLAVIPYITLSLASLPTTLILRLQSRCAEREADVCSAKKLHCAREAVDFWKQKDEKDLFGKEKKECDSVLEKVFATHPTHTERADYLEKIADQQDISFLEV